MWEEGSLAWWERLCLKLGMPKMLAPQPCPCPSSKPKFPHRKVRWRRVKSCGELRFSSAGIPGMGKWPSRHQTRARPTGPTTPIHFTRGPPVPKPVGPAPLEGECSGPLPHTPVLTLAARHHSHCSGARLGQALLSGRAQNPAGK